MKIPQEIKALIGKTRYLKTDIDQLPYIITGVLFRGRSILYEIAYNGLVKEVYDFEIQASKNELLKFNIENNQEN